MKLRLSYLYRCHLAPIELRPQAINGRFIELNRLPKEEIDCSFAWRNLPRLIKGYLRLGGFVGAGAVVDPQLNTLDVSIIVKTDLITKRYFRHYERSENRLFG